MKPRLMVLFVAAGVLLHSSLSAAGPDLLETPDLSLPSDLSLLPDEPALPPAEPGSILDVQKRLLYLNARLNRPKPARALAGPVLRGFPGDKESLLALASMELERQNAAGVRRYAREILSREPDDDQAWFFIAAAESLLGHHSAARAILDRLRREQFQGREFPYLLDLASEARRSGDWRTALATYHEILEDRRISQPLRQESRRILDEIFYEQLPRLDAGARYQWLLATGEILRSEAAWESPLTNRFRLLAEITRDDIHQRAVGNLRDLRAWRMQGLAGIEATPLDTWKLRVLAGGSSAGFTASAELARRITATRRWFLGAEYNAPAYDSLSLEVLDGRQSKLYAGWDWTPDKAANWRFAATGFGRIATVDGSPLGRGWGAEWQIERLAMRDPVEIRIAYTGQLARFDTTSTDSSLVSPLYDPGSPPAAEVAALDDEGILANTPETLIDPTISYQGLTLSARREILPRLTIETLGVFGYYLDSSQLNYGGYLRAAWSPRKSLQFEASAGYLSSGTQSNTGSQLVELALAFRLFF